MAFMRADIWTLEGNQEWHPVTEAYARAVAVMKTRPASDVTSWRFQAAIHASSGGDWRQQCQHNCWFFLSWHRAYLFWFEQIVRAAMKEVDEIDPEVREAWALPYWNYSRGGTYASLPRAFLTEQLPDGAENPLYVRERRQRINNGDALTKEAIATTEAFKAHTFTGFDGGFGGAATGKNHLDQDPAGVAGRLERTPHGSVHNGVGGPGGFMSLFETAGLDPVFWMHHANIDRLWAVWITQGFANPTDDRWLTTEFEFHDEQKQLQRSRAAGVLDTASNLGYTYEDLTVPPAAEEAAAMSRAPRPDHPPELVGATDEPLDLTGRRTSVTFGVESSRGPAAASERAGSERLYLSLDGIEGDRNPGTTYGVYLNLGDDDEPEPHYVGNVSFFGIEKSRDVRSDHPAGHGLRYVFDITDTVAALRGRDRWNPGRVEVTLAPLEEDEPVATAEAVGAPIRVGSVGLYVQ